MTISIERARTARSAKGFGSNAKGNLSSMRSFIRAALRTRKGKVIFLASFAGYWLLYALSTGIIAYFGYNALSQLISAGGTNPEVANFLAYWEYPANVYETGILWFVTPHVMLSLTLGPVFFSIILSLLFATNMLMLSLIHSRNLSGRTGLAGLAGVIPAIFSGSCCYAPFGLTVIVLVLHLSLKQSVPLYALSYTYQILDNIAITLLIVFSLIYTYRKLGEKSCCAVMNQ